MKLGIMKAIRRVGFGALVMYLFDPVNGRGRRARILDQIGAKERRIQKRATGLRQHVLNRAEGVKHEFHDAIDKLSLHDASTRSNGRHAPATR